VFFSVIDSSFPDPELFSDLASKISLLLASLVISSVWKKNLSPPLVTLFFGNGSQHQHVDECDTV
jgi:hypothetical protein